VGSNQTLGGRKNPTRHRGSGVIRLHDYSGPTWGNEVDSGKREKRNKRGKREKDGTRGKGITALNQTDAGNTFQSSTGRWWANRIPKMGREKFEKLEVRKGKALTGDRPTKAVKSPETEKVKSRRIRVWRLEAFKRGREVESNTKQEVSGRIG